MVKQIETKVIEIIPRTNGVKSFRFQVNEDIEFKTGQFFFVTIKVNTQERTKHFSFSNSPTEKEYIEFTKRITSSKFSAALDRLKIGDWARLKLPYGSFVLEAGEKKVVFLSGGIGITPIRSTCKFVTDMKLPIDIVLLYGNNKEEDIIFRQDLDAMSSVNKNIRLVYTLTSPDINAKAWKGRTGYIDDQMIKEEVPDFNQRVFYLCGPPRMVEGLRNILKNKLNLSDDKIKTENFSGY